MKAMAAGSLVRVARRLTTCGVLASASDGYQVVPALLPAYL